VDRPARGIVPWMFAAFERFASTELLVAVALGVFLVPAIFLATVAFAASRRMQGKAVSSRLAAELCLTGGASLGIMLLFAPDVTIAAPLLLVGGALAIGRWRARRTVQAGWLLAGAGLPYALAWLAVLLEQVGTSATTPSDVFLGLAAGGGTLLVGLALIRRGDPSPAAPSMAAAAGQPGSRALGSIAAAIREPGMVGPFGLPELAMLIAFVFVWITVPFLLPRDAHVIAQLALPSLIAAVVGTEAYVRSMPPRSRKAFEAFSWLGEWELARARQITGGSVSTSRDDAIRWLAERPERVDRLDDAALRVEVLLLAEQLEGAARLVERMDARADTPWERFEVAALRDLVGWRAGGDGDLAAMDAAAEAILPQDSDDRLRAEVTVAVARVRRRMADGRATAGDAVEPLLDVRKRLGDRANGQVGRALRPRLIPLLLLLSVLFGLLSLGLNALGSPLPG
jgi:hypothetical protein